MKWIIMCCFRAKFATARVAKKKYEYDFVDFARVSLIAVCPILGVTGPIIFFFDFPYENLITKLIPITFLLGNIIQAYILKRKGVYEEIIKEVESLSEEELKKYRKRNSIVVICAGSLFIIVLFGLNLWGSIRDGLI